MTKEQKQEFTRRITQAGPGAMIVILYDMELVYLTDAKAALTKGDEQVFRTQIHAAQDVLQELRQNLHLEYEPASHLLELYLFFHKQLTQALVEKNAAPIDHVTGQITALKDAYDQVLKDVEEEPLMEHAQEVYSGLTYGKGAVGEETLNYDPQRGFRA